MTAPRSRGARSIDAVGAGAVPPAVAVHPFAGTTLQLVDPAPVLAAIERLAASLEALRQEVASIAVAAAPAKAPAPMAAPAQAPAFITEKDAAAMIGATTRALRTMVDELRFPRPVRLGGNPQRDRRFVRAEVVEWIEARASEREGAALPPVS